MSRATGGRCLQRFEHHTGTGLSYQDTRKSDALPAAGVIRNGGAAALDWCHAEPAL